MGARPLSRVIAEKIKKPLADEVLFGKLAKGGNVKISVKNDELSFSYAAGNAAAKSAKSRDDALVE
jgi:ATP-dependent Clp protease ATP-binding subunit ClpA